MDDAEKAKHVAVLRKLTEPGGSIDTEAATATHKNEKYFTSRAGGGDPLPTRERLRMHKEILTEYFDEKPDVIRDRRAIVMAGPPGAGKSSAQRERIPTSEEHLWRIVDADEFKKRLLKKMRTNGQYEQMIPAEVRQRMDSGETFMPGEFAALVHEESSQLAKRAARRALSSGERVVLDGVNGTKSSLLGRLTSLRSNGYTAAEVIVVDGSKSVTRGRVENRHAKNVDKALAGDDEAAYGARFVPDYVTNGLYLDGDKYSSCTRAIGELRKDGPIDDFEITASTYYVHEVDGKPQPWASFEQVDGRFTTRKHSSIGTSGSSGSGGSGSSDSGGGGSGVYVEGYTKADGTVVQGYFRKH